MNDLEAVEPSRPSIAFVLGWFGPIPDYARFFFKGVEANPTIDVFVWSDQERPALAEGLPNVRWHRTSLGAFGGRLSEALGTPVAVPSGYKLCDTRVAFGDALADDLRDDDGRPYDFWMFGDMDVLWSDLRALLTPEWLAGVDLASFNGPWYFAGGLQLYRTDSAATSLYRRSPQWREVLADPEYRGVDECAGRFDGRVYAVADLVGRGETVSMPDLAREAATAGDLRLATPEWEGRPGAWWRTAEYPSLDYVWDRGRITDRNRPDAEVLFFHFLFLRRERFFDLGGLGGAGRPLPDRFHIGPWGVSRRSPGPLRRWAGAVRRPRFGYWLARDLLKPPVDGTAVAMREGHAVAG